MLTKTKCFLRAGMIWILVMIGYYGAAQDKIIVMSISGIGKTDNIKTQIFSNFSTDQIFRDTACIRTVFLLKFKVRQSGIDSIEFTRSTPKVIKKGILNIIQPAKGSIILSDGERFEGRTVLLPIVFSSTSGCKVPFDPVKIDSNGNVVSNTHTAKDDISLAFRTLMSLEGGNKESVDCVLLSPMSISLMH